MGNTASPEKGLSHRRRSSNWSISGKNRAAARDEGSMMVMVARKEEMAAGSDELELK